MRDLTFTIEDAVIDRTAAVPLLLFRLRIVNATPEASVTNIQLHCQARIDATQRPYAVAERARLVELFGTEDRWAESLQSLFWAQTWVQVPAFATERHIDLPVACSYDLNVATTKYFYGLASGEVPLVFLFSGTVFYRNDAGYLQMDPISWGKQASFRLPLATWQGLMDIYYPDTAWLRIDREILAALSHYKREHGLTDWNQTLGALLRLQHAEIRP